ncbi:MAG: EcoAI/FtnUII family type I restriction enzme subunit R [Bacteroidales bacterium]
MNTQAFLSEEDIKNRYITPAIEASGWFKEQMRMEYSIRFNEPFTDGKIIIKGRKASRGKIKKADYLLHHHNNFPIAIVEAKGMNCDVAEGIQQAIDYARLLDVPFAYSSNGTGFIEYDMKCGKEREIALDKFPKADELWARYCNSFEITEKVAKVVKEPYYFKEGANKPRYYQRIAINRTVEAVAKDQKKILLVMATGTGKTFTAFQIIHRLYSAKKVKKVLYLADRNILIDQTILNDFAPFKDKNILTKVEKKKLDSAYDIFMSLYHQLSGDDDLEVFRQFSPDFFDLVIVDECHRGSARENSRWRKILEYFNSAVKIGLTATPKETEDVSNSEYFGEPVYTYSLKQGIDDGFLAPYRVLRIGIDKDLEGYIPEDGKIDMYGQEIEQKTYTEKDFDRTLIIDDRTKTVAKRVTEFLKSSGDRYAKTIVFCVDEDHALRMRQALVNENSDLMSINDKYVMRITGSDALGKAQLENFIDNNSKYPTIVTTSELLSTGVDCKMCKVIVLDKVINSQTIFKQIVGRGTRLVWNRDKRYFTILDFRKATLKFSDPEFDGPSTSVYVGGKDPIPTPEGEEDDPSIVEEPQEVYKKYRINDVDTQIISELELLYGDDGKLIANHSENFKLAIIEKYANHESFHSEWMKCEKKDIIAYFEERGVDFSRLKKQVGSDVDVYDIINMIGFGLDAKLKFERANNLKDSDTYIALNEEQQSIINEVLDFYINKDITEIENNIEIFKLKDFSPFGGYVPTVKKLGGKPKYMNLLNEIITKIYE